jgi:hypothetical protein
MRLLLLQQQLLQQVLTTLVQLPQVYSCSSFLLTTTATTAIATTTAFHSYQSHQWTRMEYNDYSQRRQPRRRRWKKQHQQQRRTTIPLLVGCRHSSFFDPSSTSLSLSSSSSSSSSSTSSSASSKPQQRQVLQFNATVSDDKLQQLYAWICQIFYSNEDEDDNEDEKGDEQYNNLMYAIVAVFGTNLPSDAPMIRLLQRAMVRYQNAIQTNQIMGELLTQNEREQYSLGAMGAGQWRGQYRTRPHALLTITNMTCITDWEQRTIVSRGCKRTIQRAIQNIQQQNYTVVSKPISAQCPAPHSTYQHFKCVVQHEVRLLSSMYGDQNEDNTENDDGDDEIDIGIFVNALSEAISRYIGTTQMTGLIREYRNADNEVIAFAHEIRKGQTIRGQWFYATNVAAKQYVWFHSVRSIIERAIEENQKLSHNTYSSTNNSTSSTATTNVGWTSLFPTLFNTDTATTPTKITTVDLGPSGSDEFSDLKAKYGFTSIEDWPKVANYYGPFWDYTTNQPVQNGITY